MINRLKHCLMLFSTIFILVSVTSCNLVLEETVTSEYTVNNLTSKTEDSTQLGSNVDSGNSTVSGNTQSGDSAQQSGGTGTVQSNSSSGESKPKDTNRQEKKLSGKLELQIFTNESQTADGGWTKVINAFEDATGISVTTHMGSSVNTMMSTRWKKDNPPDFIWLDGSGIPDNQYESSGKFANLNDLYQNGYVYGTNTKINSVLDKKRLRYYGNNITRMPLLSTAGGLWYDKSFLNAKGLSAPKNYSELMGVASKAVGMGLSTYTYPGLYPSYCLSSFIAPAVAAYGQEYFDKWLSGSKAAMQDPRFKKVLTNYANFCRTSGYLMSGTTTMDHTSTQQKWINHQTLFIANGLWLPDETRKLWAQKNFDMTWMPSPLIESNQTSTVAISNKYIAVPVKAKNMENSLAFVRFLLREDSQKTLMYSFGYLGVRTDMSFDTKSFINQGGGTDAARAAANALDYILSNKVNKVYWNESWGSLGDTIAIEINELAMSDGKSVDEAISKIAAAAPKP